MRLTRAGVAVTLLAAENLWGTSAGSAQKLNNRGAAAYAAGKWDEAERLFTQALKDGATVLGSAERATILFNHAAAARSQGRFAEAAKEYEETILIRQRIFGIHSASLAGPLAGMALTLQAMGKLPQAEENARRAVSLISTAPQMDKAAAYHSLTQLLAAKGAFSEAAQHAAIALQAAAPGTVMHAEILSTLAVISRNRGEAALAETYAEAAVQFFERSLGTGHTGTAAAWNNLAQARAANGKPREARALLERAIRCFDAEPSRPHPHLASTLTNLGYLELSEKHAARAQQLFERAAEIDAAAFGSESAKVALDRNHVACALSARGRAKEALAIFSRALPVVVEAYGVDHADAGLIAGNFAIAYARRKQWEQAEPLFRQAIQIRQTLGGGNDQQLSALLEWYAIDLRNLARYGEAAQMDALSTGIRVRSALNAERQTQALKMAATTGR